jgi:hypothetical protein
VPDDSGQDSLASAWVKEVIAEVLKVKSLEKVPKKKKAGR